MNKYILCFLKRKRKVGELFKIDMEKGRGGGVEGCEAGREGKQQGWRDGLGKSRL